MPSFAYKAINEIGATVSGVMEAESVDSARAILSGQGYIPTKVEQTSGAAKQSFLSMIEAKTGKVGAADLVIFTKQFRTLLAAGVPIVRLLQVLENQTQNRTLKKAIAAIEEDVKKGSTLTGAMEKHPHIFSMLYLRMVHAGEASGTVPDILQRLAAIVEHEERVRSDIKSALQYPVMVMIALGVAFFVLLTFVIPKFAGIFAKAGLHLPLPTKIAMLMYSLLSQYWLILIAGSVVLVIALGYYFNTKQGRFLLDSFLLKLPLIGPLFIKSAMSRFASIFAILQASGVPIMQTLEVLTGTIGNVAISREFERVRDRIREGHGISGPMKSARYFTPMVIDMIAIGEESGNIEAMLRAVSEHYDAEVAYAVKSMSDAIGPILTVGLAAVVGFFALAIFLPMWDLTKMVK
ncbi:MAG: type II secretion system F family protein [Syntrophus sp. (in: bacteria)]|nr:type II secretion system F family protein [Syntrophus sp. (in: bacteria)]